MSIIDTFDDRSVELLRASDLPENVGGNNLPDFPETVIVTFSDKTRDVVLSDYDAEEIGFMVDGGKLPIYRFRYRDKWIGFYRTGMGAPLAVALMEEVIAKGAMNFIFFGSCGVLDERLTEGHIIVPTEAYRDEGTSYHYMPAGDYVRITNAEKVAEILSDMDVPHISGRIWTTDGLYRETRNNVDARKADGCLAVDMECSALEAASRFRGVDLYQFIYAEDSLSGKTWEPRNIGRVPHSTMEKYLLIAAEMALRI